MTRATVSDLIQRLRSRREVLQVGGMLGATALTGCAVNATASNNYTTSVPMVSAASGATPVATATTAPAATVTPAALSCVLTPSLTEGPYFVDERLLRSDIRTDPSDNSTVTGATLTLALQVVRVSGNTCLPVAGAAVDVWHCNALGVYSDVSDAGFNTKGKKFLRGYQVTDANGMVNFTTIYPGWYSGRAVHIHFKVRTNIESANGYELTSQWFFDDTLSDQVFANAPYAAKGTRDRRNANDDIYKQAGSQMVLPVVKSGDAYAATYVIGLRAA